MKTCVLGVGNELCGDDGIGPAIIKELQFKQWTTPIDLISTEGDLFSLLEYAKEYEQLFIIDALHRINEPGKIHIIPLASMISDAKSVLSLHDVDLITLLKWINVNSSSSITLLGIEIHCISQRIGLSPELSQKFHEIIEQIYRWIENEISLSTKM